jgi:hypothetical protein
MATRTKKAPEAEIEITEVGPTDAVEENLLADTDYDQEHLVDGGKDPDEDGGEDEGYEPDGQFHHESQGVEVAPEAPEEAPELPVRLVGQELLDFYNAKKAEGWSHETIGFNAGYVSITKTKQERFQAAAFNKEYLKAQGTIQEGESSPGGGRSHAGETRARVTGQGVLLVSQLAVNRVGAVAGEVFAVEYPADGQILLTTTGVVEAVIPRGKRAAPEQAGTPLLDQTSEA